jgi:hypothetical protein
MAICYPDYEKGQEAKIESKAEILFYNSCKTTLPDSYQVFHSVSWITSMLGKARDGEADFLICHPDRGFIVIEIKGGRIRADMTSGIWTSIDRAGVSHKISNPFRQATSGKYNILGKMKEHREWPKLNLKWVSAGHAAFFPDVDDGRALQGPEAPTEIIGDRSDLIDLKKWVERVFDYWSDQNHAHSEKPLGSAGVQFMRKLFARVAEARPLLSSKLADEEQERLQLTSQQIQILNLLSRQRRVAISGGAGTGKTVLALEKARRLASEGFQTLLTCYNAPLSDHLRKISRSEDNLTVMGFHKLCKTLVDQASKQSGRDLIGEARGSYPGMDLWDHYYPIALAYALEILKIRYDAIVVDEGQDFGGEFWLPIEFLLKDSTTSPLYIFYDENQNVYTRASTFPADAAPITLTVNCRNTKKIHQAAYHYYSGAPVDAPSISGDSVHFLEAPNAEKQAKKIYELVTKLVISEKVESSSIAILIADKLRRKSYEKILYEFKLPGQNYWGGIDDPSVSCVSVETVARFKGLESSIIILWGLDSIPIEEKRETLYVGISRAKSILYLCGMKAMCEMVIEGN